MNGTCIECKPQRVDGEEELVILSFFSEVCPHPQINESAKSVSQNIQRLLLSVDQYLNHWKRYRPLWEKNKSIVNEKFAARKPSCVMYDDKFQSLSHMKQEVMLEPLFRNEHIVHLNLQPLAQIVQKTAESWISSLGSLLNKSAKEDLFNLRDELMVLNHAPLFVSSMFTINIILFLYMIYPYAYFIHQELSEMLKQSPDTIEDLKSVFKTISAIRDMSLDVQLRFLDIQERYRTLAMYNVEVMCV